MTQLPLLPRVRTVGLTDETVRRGPGRPQGSTGTHVSRFEQAAKLRAYKRAYMRARRQGTQLKLPFGRTRALSAEERQGRLAESRKQYQLRARQRQLEAGVLSRGKFKRMDDEPSRVAAPAGMACESRSWILRGLYQEQWTDFLDHTWYPKEYIPVAVQEAPLTVHDYYQRFSQRTKGVDT